MLRACAKRPVSYESLERAVSSIEQTLMSTYDREVTSVRIGELTMQELKKSTRWPMSVLPRSISSLRTSKASSMS